MARYWVGEEVEKMMSAGLTFDDVKAAAEKAGISTGWMEDPREAYVPDGYATVSAFERLVLTVVPEPITGRQQAFLISLSTGRAAELAEAMGIIKDGEIDRTWIAGLTKAEASRTIDRLLSAR